MNSQSASFITDRHIRDRQVAIAQRAERKLQRGLSLNEIELDMDMRWSSRFMPREISREQKRSISAK
ncbi:MAG: hypothetical protein ACOYN8_04620 [Pseudanabaena sp.]|jgi:hypothetical protein